MSRVLDISDDLYARLEAEAQSRGLPSIELLLQEWEQEQRELLRRRKAIGRIDGLRERLAAKYGQMPDSTELLREDRDLR